MQGACKAAKTAFAVLDGGVVGGFRYVMQCQVLLAWCIVASGAQGIGAYLGNGHTWLHSALARACGSWRATVGRGGSASEL